MTRGRKAKVDGIDDDEEAILEELKGRKDECSCDEDPLWCPRHNEFV